FLSSRPRPFLPILVCTPTPPTPRQRVSAWTSVELFLLGRAETSQLHFHTALPQPLPYSPKPKRRPVTRPCATARSSPQPCCCLHLPKTARRDPLSERHYTLSSVARAIPRLRAIAANCSPPPQGLSFTPEQRVAKNLTGLIPHVMEDGSRQCE